MVLESFFPLLQQEEEDSRGIKKNKKEKLTINEKQNTGEHGTNTVCRPGLLSQSTAEIINKYNEDNGIQALIPLHKGNPHKVGRRHTQAMLRLDKDIRNRLELK